MLSPWPVSHVLVTTHTDSHAPSSPLVTRLLRLSDSGDFWSPQRALSLTQVWSSSWSPTLTANITLMDPCFLIIRCTVHFLEPFLLYFSFYQTWGSYWQYCGTCKLWAGPGPLTVSSCDGEKLRSRDCWDPEWAVSADLSWADQKMSWSCEWVFRILTPPPLWWPLTMGAVSHSRPLLCDIPHTHQTQWLCKYICETYFVYLCIRWRVSIGFNNSISFINCQKNQEVAWVFF